MTRKERRAETHVKRMEIVRLVDTLFWEIMKGMQADKNGNMPVAASVKVVARHVDGMVEKAPRDRELIVSAVSKWQAILIAVLKKRGVTKDVYRMELREETKGRIEG